jgi:hypothetical protein
MRPRRRIAVPRLLLVLGLPALAATCSSSDSDDSSGQEVSGDGGRCVGTPAPCESFRDYDSCQRQAGCGWVFYYNDCRNDLPTGPYACELLNDREDVCLGQVGCSWVE